MDISKSAESYGEQLQATIADLVSRAVGFNPKHQFDDGAKRAIKEVIQLAIDDATSKIKSQRDGLTSAVKAYRQVAEPVMREEEKRMQNGHSPRIAATIRVDVLASAFTIGEDALLKL